MTCIYRRILCICCLTIATMKTGREQPKNLIFVHSAIDQAGLDVYEFRLLGHIARRGSCFASLDTTAELCQMSVRKAQYTLKALLDKGFIVKTQRKGRTDIYHLAPDLWEKLGAAAKVKDS